MHKAPGLAPWLYRALRTRMAIAYYRKQKGLDQPGVTPTLDDYAELFDKGLDWPPMFDATEDDFSLDDVFDGGDQPQD